MSAAQVRSTEAIEALNLALARFGERVGNALDALDGELRRTDGWIDHERPPYWRDQKHQAETAVHDAKLELERCLMMTTADGQRPACREQKDAVAAAKRRLDYCREKVDVVKKWQRSFRHDAMEFHGRIGQLRRLIDLDVPSARGVLAKILHQIEEYQLEKAPDAFALHGMPQQGTGESNARAEAPTSAGPPASPPAAATIPPSPDDTAETS
jgi:hypothetical protein